jgi:broad specificity phosphatase PhoE
MARVGKILERKETMKQSICKLFIVRHGQSEFNRDSIIAGHFNPKLTQQGISEAKETARALKGIKFDDVFSSDLSRAVETAEIIVGYKVPKSHQLKALRERDYGPELHGMPANKLIGMQEAIMRLNPKERWLYRHVEEMENDAELVQRFMQALEGIADNNLGKIILVATHGGSIRILLMKLGFGNHATLPSGSFGNGGYIELIYDGSKFGISKVVG